MKDLFEKKASLVAEARGIVNAAEQAGKPMSQEDNNRFDALMSEVNSISADIEKRERLAKVEAGLNASTGVISGRDSGNGNKGSDTEKRAAAFVKYIAHGPQTLNGEEFRALAAGSDSTGGAFLAPDQMVNAVIKAIDNESVVYPNASKFTLQGAKSLGAPVITANPADSDWTTEVQATSLDTTMATSRRELTPNTLTKMIKVSEKLLKNAVNAEQIVVDRMSYVLGQTYEKAFVAGSGSSQPLGLFTASASGVTTGRDMSTGNTSTAITFDGLMNAKYSLKGGYLRNAKWIFHRDAVSMIAKIKDTAGQYVWQQSLRDGQPDSLLGMPVLISEYAPNTFTTGLYVGILGDLSYYWIAELPGFGVTRLNELYAGTNEVGFKVHAEIDGAPVLAEAFARVKLA